MSNEKYDWLIVVAIALTVAFTVSYLSKHPPKPYIPAEVIVKPHVDPYEDPNGGKPTIVPQRLYP